MAQSEMGRLVGQQALTLAFQDVFRLMSYAFLGSLVLVPFCRVKPNAALPPDAH